MATVTITEILGGDNIAGSRITINDNFKKLANSINTLETYLDTSFTPGAALNVGSALVKRYTRPVTDQIFTCEATGLFGGSLNVSQNLGITLDATFSRHITVHGNVTFDGTVAASNSITSDIPLNIDAPISSPQWWASATSNSYVLDPQLLAGSGASRQIVTSSAWPKYSVIRLDWAAYDGIAPNDCNTIILPAVSDPNVTNGQIITIICDAPSGTPGTTANFGIDTTNMDTGVYTTIEFNSNPSDADQTTLRSSSITVVADDNGWRIIGSAGLSTITI